MNLTIKNPKTGQWFELQFHTPESLATKNKIHPFFEKHRTLMPDDPRKQELFDKMVNMAGDQPFPPNIQRIIGLIL